MQISTALTSLALASTLVAAVPAPAPSPAAERSAFHLDERSAAIEDLSNKLFGRNKKHTHRTSLHKDDLYYAKNQRHRSGKDLQHWALSERQRVKTRHSKHAQADYTATPEWLRKRGEVSQFDVGLDSFFYARVDIGTPAQSFNLYLDTGSADLWVIGTTCTGQFKSYCSQVPVFDSSKSSSFAGSQQRETISYLDGTGFTGDLSNDTVSFAGFQLENVPFILIDTLNSDPNQAPTSGLIGLSYQQESVSKSEPFTQRLATEGKLPTNANGFAMVFTRTSRNSTTEASGYDGIQAGGVFEAGEFDTDSYTGSINFIDVPSEVQQEGSWAIPLDAISIAGQSGSLNGAIAYIDSGTSLLYMPSSVNRGIYSRISGARQLTGNMAGYYSIPCDGVNAQLGFTFNGQTYMVNDQDLNAGALDTSGSTCLGGIVDSDGSGVDFLLGNLYMKNVFNIFSYGSNNNGPQIGFAQLPSAGAPASASGSQAVTGVVSASAPSSRSNTFGSATRTTGPGSSSTSSSSSGNGGVFGGIFGGSSSSGAASVVAAGQGFGSVTFLVAGAIGALCLAF